jgi:hypothetical protein
MHKLQHINFNLLYLFLIFWAQFSTPQNSQFILLKIHISPKKFQNSKNSQWKESLIKRILHICVQILGVFRAQRVITSVRMVYRGAHGINQCPVGLRTRLITIQGLRRLSSLNFNGYHFTWNSHPLRTKRPYTYENCTDCRPPPTLILKVWYILHTCGINQCRAGIRARLITSRPFKSIIRSELQRLSLYVKVSPFQKQGLTNMRTAPNATRPQP